MLTVLKLFIQPVVLDDVLDAGNASDKRRGKKRKRKKPALREHMPCKECMRVLQEWRRGS